MFPFWSRFSKCTLAFSLILGLAAVAGAEPDHAGTTPAAGADSSGQGSSTWEFGPFLNGGVGLGNRSDFSFLSPGFQVGKTLTPVVKAGPLSGRFEFAGNIMPLWLAFTPAPHSQIAIASDGTPVLQQVGGGTFTGLSITPVIFRWNFANHSRRFKPWVQAAGGLIYTTHKFPPNIEVPKGTPGGTSVFNFSPQGGGGFHYFLRPRRSIDFGVNAVHISSASLGDRNPGVNASLQFQLGYTWWK
ncbi:acyloxyacyl hydrolase [Acidicapsa ligni]|uniref:acyloxyacyl hydrolase n=1 Tax=Acidicapsa ligni TaxID=542300 RepID=UPI0021E0E782|nr:acyloxyacyl hydrolase [Acidicapsa ligni]